MIITKTVMATVSGRNKPHFESKGYKLPYEKDEKGRLGVKKGSKLEVSVFDLPVSSNVKIKYKCDDCGIVKEVCAHTLFYRENSQYRNERRLLRNASSRSTTTYRESLSRRAESFSS